MQIYLLPLANQFPKFLDQLGTWILRPAMRQVIKAAPNFDVANETS